MEGAVIHVFQLLKTVLRVVTLGDKGASRENHTVLQVRHTELEMQAVVDFLRDFEDVVAIEFLARTQADIVVLVFQALGRIRQLDFVLEHADSTAAIENTDGLGVFLGNHINVLEQFLDMLFLGNTFCFRFRLQNDGGVAGVIRQIPAIRFIITATESQLIEGSDLPSPLLHSIFGLIKAKNQLGAVTNLILCTHSLAHSILPKTKPPMPKHRRCKNLLFIVQNCQQLIEAGHIPVFLCHLVRHRNQLAHVIKNLHAIVGAFVVLVDISLLSCLEILVIAAVGVKVLHTLTLDGDVLARQEEIQALLPHPREHLLPLVLYAVAFQHHEHIVFEVGLLAQEIFGVPVDDRLGSLVDSLVGVQLLVVNGRRSHIDDPAALQMPEMPAALRLEYTEPGKRPFSGTIIHIDDDALFEVHDGLLGGVQAFSDIPNRFLFPVCVYDTLLNLPTQTPPLPEAYRMQPDLQYQRR